MATLTKSTGTVALSGAAERVTLPASYGWVWVKNMSEGDIFAGLSADISVGADGVLTIPSGECGRVQTDGFFSVYLLGTGNALVVAQNYADCPFKVGGKGGEIPDLSLYAKKSDVPNIKVNSAVDADTVDGKSIDDIFHSTTINAVMDIDNTDGNWSTDFVTAWSPIAGTFPDGVYDRWFSVRQYQSSATKDFKIQFLQTIESLPRMWHRCKQHEGVWTNWQEIYTSVNKPYIVGSATVTAGSSVCVSEHGFIPSAVFWWENTGAVYSATSFDTTSFSINSSSNVDRTINYLIFK